ncbi:MAG: hypothetical protein HY370_08675 [Proteobacteria bacterium]|nr:hypothetical protein [Pseudomonadota bacterium]
MDVSRVKQEFFEKAVEAKYSTVEASLRRVRGVVIYFEFKFPHISQNHNVDEPADYLMPGAEIVRSIDAFIARYQKVMTPREAEKADGELSEILKKAHDFIASDLGKDEMNFSFGDMSAEERARIIANLQLAKLRDFLVEWDSANARAMQAVRFILAPAPGPVVRKIVNDAMLGSWEAQKQKPGDPILQ